MKNKIKKFRHSCKPIHSSKPSKENPEIVPFYDGDIVRYRVKNQFLIQTNQSTEGLKGLIKQLESKKIKYKFDVCACNPNLIKLEVDDESKIEIEGNPKQIKTGSGEVESLYFNEVITKTLELNQDAMVDTYKEYKSRIHKSRKAKKIAILDTGISTNLLISEMQSIFLPAMPRKSACGDKNKYILGTDITKSGTGLTDISGHGSFVANSLLYSLLQEGVDAVSIIPVKVFKRVNGILTADLFDILCGLYYAHKQNADYINLSLGVQTSSNGLVLLNNAIQTITKECKSIVCSGGNDGMSLNKNVHYPSGFSKTNPYVFEALARRDKSTLLQFSNFYDDVPQNGQTGIAVCGNFSFYIKSLRKFVQVEGTSFAAPYLLGKLSANKSFTTMQVLKRQLSNELVQVQT